MTEPKLPKLTIPSHVTQSAGQKTLVQFERYGSRFATPLARVSLHSDSGMRILNRFTEVMEAFHPREPVLVKAFQDACDQLEDFAKKNLEGVELKTIQEEIEHYRKVAAYRISTAGAEMPGWAKVRLSASRSIWVYSRMHTALYQSVFMERIETIALKASLSSTEQLALKTYRQIHRAVGRQNEDGWARAFEYCAHNAEKIMSVNQALKAVEEQIAQMPSSPALQASLKNMQKRFGGHFSNVRGALGEIYLEHWDDWKLLRKSLKEIAKRDARKLGKDWQPLSFSGGAWIDGKLAWDEGNLLIKVPSASDRYPLAAIHTAAQLKVANKVEAIKQTILDRIRERGLSLEPPKLTIIQEGEIRMFVLIAPPPSINVHRYLFYAEGGRIPLSHFNQLKTLGLRVDGTPLDISIEGFNALTRQMLDVAEEYLKRVASGK